MNSIPPPNLRDDIMYLKGVGPLRAEILHRIGLHRALDLLFYFPRDYDEIPNIVPIKKLEENKDKQTVCGVIEEWEERSTRRGPMLSLTIQCGEKYVKGLWWFRENRKFLLISLRKEFAKGRKLLFTGRPKYDSPFWIMMHPQITYIADDDDINNAEPYQPVYPLTEGLKQFHLRKILREMLPTYAPLLDEVFPPDYLEPHKLLPLAEAVKEIHFPLDKPSMLWAKRRFVYQELFILQLGLAARRLQHRIQFKSPPFRVSKEVDNRIRHRFPFDLTKAQEKVVKEIVHDLEQPFPMNRLLQGDVGSGKTVVALYAMLAAVANGYQAVFMAPTEVLARQHIRTLSRMLEGSQVKIAPLFGGQKPNERATILQSVSTSESQIIVGTQAIICSEIPFHQLGLVVIDEQHKFGVMQRAALKTGRDVDPHYLVMTATPIPRSVTMTLFGDLDVSIMDGMPPGRQKVKTYIAEPEQQADWWTFFRRKIEDEGWQGYVVVPLIENGEWKMENGEEQESFVSHSLLDIHERLSGNELKSLRLAVIHGRMSTEEKEKIMFDFRTGEIQVLIATTVIEVGVDVPNANLMTIMSGERFGLSQLHQLRGRIGRGKNPGYCTVFTSNKETTVKDKDKETAAAAAVKSKERLKAFEKLSDGFKLAEKDFEIRGAGDLFGTQQHGMPPFRVADLVRDKDVLYEARRDAAEMVQNDPGLSKPEHAKLRKQMLNRYGKVLDLGDVG